MKKRCKHNWIREKIEYNGHCAHAFGAPPWICTKCKENYFDHRSSGGGPFILPKVGLFKSDKHGNWIIPKKGIYVVDEQDNLVEK
jgi:hypothetical protein